jgi:hypothetical protein
MKPLRTLFALTLVTSLVAADVPACRAATDHATAESLARDSGLWKALGDVLADLHTDLDHAIAESATKPDRKELAELERRIDTAFAPQRLQAIGVSILEKELDPKHIPALQAWFASATGKAITKVETAAPGGQLGLLELRKEGAALLEQVPEARRDLLEEILIATRASELAATIAVQSVLVLASAVRRAAPDARVPTEQRLRAELSAARPRMEREISSSMLQMFAAIYRKIPDADLRKYEEVLTSTAGRHLTGVLAHALEEAVVAGTKHFWEDLLPAGKTASAP